MTDQLAATIDAAWEARDAVSTATRGEVRDAPGEPGRRHDFHTRANAPKAASFLRPASTRPNSTPIHTP